MSVPQFAKTFALSKSNFTLSMLFCISVDLAKLIYTFAILLCRFSFISDLILLYSSRSAHKLSFFNYRIHLSRLRRIPLIFLELHFCNFLPLCSSTLHVVDIKSHLTFGGSYILLRFLFLINMLPSNVCVLERFCTEDFIVPGFEDSF